MTAPKKYALIPLSLLVEANHLEAMVFTVGADPDAEDPDDRWSAGVLTVGTVEGDTPAENQHGLAIYSEDYPDEGCALLAEFPESPTKALNDLLALIHRDGGHYVDEHGHEVALRTALRLIEDQRRITAEYLAARDAYEEAVKPSGGFGQPKRLAYGDPVLARWINARSALQKLQES